MASWQQPFVDSTNLTSLRQKLAETHLVLRKRNAVQIVPYDGVVPAENTIDYIDLKEDHHTANALARHWLENSLRANKMTHMRKENIRYISEQPNSNLLAACIPNDVVVPQGISVNIGADLDFRQIYFQGNSSTTALTINVRSRVILDCPVSELLKVGFSPVGLYVRQDHGLGSGGLPKRSLVGRVETVDGTVLHLTDNVEGVRTISASEAYLEPRLENVRRVLWSISKGRSEQVFDKLKVASATRLSGPNRLRLARAWIPFLQKQPPVLAQNATIEFAADFISSMTRFPTSEILARPRLVFDVGATKLDVWNQRGLDTNGPFNWEQFAPRDLNIAVICQASKQGQVEQFVSKLMNGIPNTAAAPGFIGRFHLGRPNVQFFPTQSERPEDYRSACGDALDHITDQGMRWHLALVQIDESFHMLQGDANPYLVAKAFLLSKEIAVQQFEHQTMSQPDKQLAYTLNNIGLACYAKIGGIPWVLPVHQAVAHELIIGIGSYMSTTGRLGNRERYVGVTTVFSADGRYLLETRTRSAPFAEYVQVLIEALERVIQDIRRKDGWDERDRVRLVFHVFKPLKFTEVEAVQALMTRLGLPHVEYAFLHVVENQPCFVFDERNGGEPARDRKKGEFAPPRGLSIRLSRSETLVCLRGSRELKQWTDGLPQPLLLRLHRDSTFRDMDYLARQLFAFSSLSWRTFLPSPTPITVLYSDLVAKNLQLLSQVAGWSSEQILGPIGRTRWFL